MSTVSKITIAQPLLDLLQSDAKLKAVFIPDAEDQRITRLVSPGTRAGVRIFEKNVYICSGDKNHSSKPDKVLLEFSAAQIERIKKLQQLVTENLLNFVDQSANYDNVGKADFQKYNELTGVYHESGRIYGNCLEQYASVKDSDIIFRSSLLDTKSLYKKYPDNELLSYKELLSSKHQIFIVGIGGNTVEMTAADRALRIYTSGIYTKIDQHPEYCYGDWQQETRDGNTQISYNDWVHHRLMEEYQDNELNKPFITVVDRQDGEPRSVDHKVYSENDEHSEYPFIDWQYEVENGDTQIGYNDWVYHQLEADERHTDNSEASPRLF